MHLLFSHPKTQGPVDRGSGVWGVEVSFSDFFQIQFFCQIQALIQAHGQDAENYNGHQHHIQLEDLAPVDDKIAQSFPASDEFADDDAHQAEADIDFHRIQKDGHRTGQDDFGEHIPFPAAQGINEFGFLRVHFQKAGVDGENASEYGHGHTCHDDSPHIGSQPYDEKRGQSRFRQAVQDYQIRLQDAGEGSAHPQQDRGQDACGKDQEKA